MWWELKVWNFVAEGWAQHCKCHRASACHFWTRWSVTCTVQSITRHPSLRYWFLRPISSRCRAIILLYEALWNWRTKGNGDGNHLYQGPKRSMRTDVWIQTWPTVIIDIDYQNQTKGQETEVDKIRHFPKTWLWIHWWRKIIELNDKDVQAYEQDPVWAFKISSSTFELFLK